MRLLLFAQAEISESLTQREMGNKFRDPFVN